MHQYKNKKLLKSFSDIYTDITNTDELQTRHNDYNFVINPVVKRNLVSFPLRQILYNWNALYIFYLQLFEPLCALKWLLSSRTKVTLKVLLAYCRKQVSASALITSDNCYGEKQRN